jgi:SnoaL-like domain
MTETTLTVQAENLLDAYCAAVDGRHLEQIQALFAEAGTFSTRGRLMTPRERDAFFSDLWASTRDRSTHVCRDVQVAREGDTVKINALLTATFILPDGSVRFAFGHYDDEAEMTTAGLRLTAKRIVLDRVEVMTPDQATAAG